MNVDEALVGKYVIIKRSSGAKQEGWVSKIDHSNKCVLVEWQENMQCKAKEVSFEQLKSWNKELFNQPLNIVDTKKNSDINLYDKFEDGSDGNNKQKLQLQRALNSRKTTVFSRTSPLFHKRKPSIHNVDLKDENKLTGANRISPVKKKAKTSQQFVSSNTANMNDNSTKSRYSRPSLYSQKIASVDRNVKSTVNVPIHINDDNNDDNIISPNSPHYAFYNMIKEYRNNTEFKQVISYDSDDSMSKNLQICVCIRKRPLNSKEINNKEIDVVTMTSKQQTLVHECRHKVDMTKYLENHDFVFDYCFNEYCDNSTIYRYTTKPLVECIFDGGMATCFAYGQTGSGKTFTMGGNYFTDNTNGIVEEEKGIYDYAAREIFLKLKSYHGAYVTISVYEIYGTKVYDLLNEKRILRVMENGQGSVKVCELKEIPVSSEREIQTHIRAALKIRSSGVTSANANSSRSHAIIQFVIYKREDIRKKTMLGKLSLIDLAGNERGADTKTCDRSTRMEGAEINKSLLALKECIRALGRKNAHLPFRSSKLTQVLKDSFLHEKARTCMIATISPGISCCENTLNTLHYANRVKQLGSKNQNNQENTSRDDNKLNIDYHNDLMDHDEEITPDNLDLNKIKEDLIDEHILTINESDNITDFEKHLISKVDHISIEDYLEKLDNFVSKKLNMYESLTDKILQVRQTLNDAKYRPR